tara:strand:+ start:740 stop:1066 length:327 start_codon:yes stop_codon:yes gene_type:complete
MFDWQADGVALPLAKNKGKDMENLKNLCASAMLLALSASVNAIETDSPTGAGVMMVTNISIGSDGTTFDFEGTVENYGTVFATYYLQSVDGERTRGTVTGQAPSASYA